MTTTIGPLEWTRIDAARVFVAGPTIVGALDARDHIEWCMNDPHTNIGMAAWTLQRGYIVRVADWHDGSDVLAPHTGRQVAAMAGTHITRGHRLQRRLITLYRYGMGRVRVTEYQVVAK